MDGDVLVAGVLYREIRERILSGHYPPGSVLRQEDIARQFAASRVPLREAFSKLEAEGFLILRPRRGYAVISLDAAEIAEIFDLRTVIEGHAGTIATRNQKPGDAEDLAVLIGAMEAEDPSTSVGLARWCELNRQFHERILICCDRPHLQRISMQLRDQVEPYVRVELTMTGHVAEATRDHDEILAAFRSGDAELMGELCAVHVSRTARRLLDSIRAIQRPSTGGGAAEDSGPQRGRKGGTA